MELIQRYFPNLSDLQYNQIKALGDLYTDWNAKINVISRKDMEHFYERHVLHSLAIAKVIQFKSDTQILDVGTGGGFPGIPLAILFPDVSFHLVDSIGKKIKVVQEVSNAIELTNLSAEHARAEQVSGQFDFVVSRAVTRLA
jgi:16S rRNA (guanine527-N7)-methyltransferase